MAFVPPQDDKIKKMGKKEKIPAYIYADPDDPNIIYIKTNGVIQIVDNSIYEVVIKDLEFEDGEIIEKYTNDFITAMSPCYVDVDEVLALCNYMEGIDEKDVLIHIKSACQEVNFYAHEDDLNPSRFTKENLQKEYYPFYMFVKYKAAVETLKAFYIGAVTRPKKIHDVLSDLERLEEYDLDAIRKLLELLEEEAEHWVGHVATITADPEWALRGKYSYAIAPPSSIHYHNTYIDKKGGGNGWNRGY